VEKLETDSEMWSENAICYRVPQGFKVNLSKYHKECIHVQESSHTMLFHLTLKSETVIRKYISQHRKIIL